MLILPLPSQLLIAVFSNCNRQLGIAIDIAPPTALINDWRRAGCTRACCCYMLNIPVLSQPRAFLLMTATGIWELTGVR